MVRLPVEAAALLDHISVNFSVLLGRNLVGIYLYGSITNSSFRQNRSDIDCIVVTKRRVSEAQFRKLNTWLQRLTESHKWAARLQVSFLVKAELLVWSDPSNPTSCSFQFGILQRCGSDGNPIIWLDHLRRGKVLVGPPAESFLPAITEEMLTTALKRELGYLREELANRESEWRDVLMYRAYATLTICRILYTQAKGTVVSKSIAAGWTMRTFPSCYCEIIEKALSYNKTGRDVQISLRTLRRFLEFAARSIEDSQRSRVNS